MIHMDVLITFTFSLFTFRCFSFGIGAGASTDLVRGLAKAGGGIAEFVSGSDRLQAKVIRDSPHQSILTYPFQS